MRMPRQTLIQNTRRVNQALLGSKMKCTKYHTSKSHSPKPPNHDTNIESKSTVIRLPWVNTCGISGEDPSLIALDRIMLTVFLAALDQTIGSSESLIKLCIYTDFCSSSCNCSTYHRSRPRWLIRLFMGRNSLLAYCIGIRPFVRETIGIDQPSHR